MMNFKRISAVAALAAATVSPGVFAQLSGNVGVTSEYMFRGLEQSSGAAVQGGLDYSHDSGFYAGTWMSTIEFGGVSASGNSIEVDYYAGFSGGDAISYDVGLIYYWYPEEDEGPDPDPSNNTFEAYASVGAGPFSVGVSYSFLDYFATTDDPVIYPNASFSQPLTEKLSLDISVGYTYFDESAQDNYIDYIVGLGMDVGHGFSAAVQLVHTDLDGDDPKIVLSGGYGFDL